jgi:biotin transporter BioY
MRNKALLISFLLAMVMIPAFASRDPSAVRGLKRALAWTLAAVVAYAIGLGWLYQIWE